MRILFTGGGTGGHFFPILAVIRELKRIAEEERILDVELFYMGAHAGFEDLLKEEQVVTVTIAAGKLRRYFSLANIFDSVKVVIGVAQAVWNTFLIMPDVIFSKGGYGAFPVVIAAALFRIPLIIHESDAVPGRVSTFSARFASRIGVAFSAAAEYFPKEKIAWVGVPIRKRVLGGNKDEAKENLNIFTRLPVIACIGASQGAQRLNEALLEIVKDLTEEYEVVHQTGSKNFEGVKGESQAILEFTHKERYHAFGFLDETSIRDFYMVSDLIISRAGASSIFEIAAWGKPSILLPLRHAAQDHQRKNAYQYAATGAALVIEEENLTPHILMSEIKKVMGDPALLDSMGKAAQKFARIDSAEVVAREVLKLGVH